ncbi:hypothetical protein RIF29_24662 [Crotalaria pallida]|uniref:Uncharacterized protein n=1 Tax=Crotalaria pallida TaxID=3830 RepID=A0AAN9EK46_CROPI
MILRPILPQLGNLPTTKLFVWPGASLWALGKESHLVELAKNSTKEGLSGKEAIRQHRKYGTLFTALYLKQCAAVMPDSEVRRGRKPKTLSLSPGRPKELYSSALRGRRAGNLRSPKIELRLRLAQKER